MEKVCHTIVNDVGDDNVFLEGNKKRKKNIENNKKMCPHGAYTCWGPQGSINICVALCMPEYGSKL